jgi:hypothetical protein
VSAAPEGSIGVTLVIWAAWVVGAAAIVLLGMFLASVAGGFFGAALVVLGALLAALGALFGR